MSDRPEFDHAKAHALIDKLNATIRMLQQQTGDRSTKASGLKKNWTGRYANEFFDTEVPRMKSQAGGLITQMQGLVRQLHTADTNATNDENQWQRSQPQPTPAPGPAPSPPKSTPAPTPTPAPPGPTPTPPATPR